MLFNSKLFVLAFLPLALGGFLALGRCGRRAAMLWLLACSLVFYAWGKPAFLLLLLGSIGANFSWRGGWRKVPGGAGWWRGWRSILCCSGFSNMRGFRGAMFGLPRPSAACRRRSGSVFSPFSR